MVVAPPTATGETFPVEVQATGPQSITASTQRPTGRIVATFTISDPTLTATGATICRSFGEKTEVGCRYQRFDGQDVSDSWDDDVYYDDDDEYVGWTIDGQPGSWIVSYPIGFEEISREECVAATWGEDGPFSAAIDVQNDAGTLIGAAQWDYQVNCTGIVGGALGPEKTRVFAGRGTESKSFDFLVVDKERILDSYRICNYNAISGRYFGCDREDLKKRDRTDDGWAVSYSITWNAVGSATCRYIDRQWPQAGLRVQFYDDDLRKQLQIFKGTQLRC